jgi:CheY-like chemotaxis protein
MLVEKVQLKKNSRILIIEDDADTSNLLCKSLKLKYDCLIDKANDPFEAMNLMVEKFYDLIILDWQLPGLNGSETLIEAENGRNLEPTLRLQWGQAKTAVVIFSACSQQHCVTQKNDYFSYIGYVSKIQSLSSLINAFGEFIKYKKDPHYLISFVN